ncbi:hypothetical protein HPB50_024313 [Hyalomma asiaticum]|uniref:Uncharacterized protein n=1 Tax=Hyalomma asiaticum TaxID=266040 RepID=A0ACB7T9D2_HYAAI|nr:hypothetical protein HPB50_024313 [Hyalomma asiaticum]
MTSDLLDPHQWTRGSLAAVFRANARLQLPLSGPGKDSSTAPYTVNGRYRAGPSRPTVAASRPSRTASRGYRRAILFLQKAQYGCDAAKKIALEKVPPATAIDIPKRFGHNGVQELYISAFRRFGSLWLSNDIPKVLQKATALDDELMTNLLLGGAGGSWMIVLCSILAVLVPVIGLRSLWRRYEQPPVYEEPETEDQAVSRVKTSIYFWVFIVLLV